MDIMQSLAAAGNIKAPDPLLSYLFGRQEEIFNVTGFAAARTATK